MASQLAKLEARLCELRSVIPTTKGIGFSQYKPSFIASLPCEILSAIFNEGPTDPEDRTRFAISVSQVSRFWRETAMQTRYIWSGIILLPWRTGSGYQNFLKVLISRSQSHPLDVQIHLNEWDKPHTLDHLLLRTQIDVVILEIARWRSFGFWCGEPDDISDVMARLHHLSAPILESFDFCFTSEEMSGRVLWKIFEAGAPMLSHVHLYGVTPIDLLVPLSSVTSLHLEFGHVVNRLMPGKDLLQVLRSLSALVFLNLDGVFVDLYDLHQQSLQGKHVEIATLRSLSFSANAFSKYCIQSVLSTIRCPALESLTISGFDAWDNLSPTQHLPIPPLPALRSIKLYRINCNQFVTNFDFTHLPALESISLRECTFPIALIRTLLPSQGRASGDVVWPVLRVINLWHLDTKDFDCLREAMSHRHACGKPISVTLDPEVLQNFKAISRRLHTDSHTVTHLQSP